MAGARVVLAPSCSCSGRARWLDSMNSAGSDNRNSPLFEPLEPRLLLNGYFMISASWFASTDQQHMKGCIAMKNGSRNLTY